MPLRLEPCRKQALARLPVQQDAAQPRLRHGDLCSPPAAAAASPHHRRRDRGRGPCRVLRRWKPACRQGLVCRVKASCSTSHPFARLRPALRGPAVLLLPHGGKARWWARAEGSGLGRAHGAEGRKALLWQSRPARRRSKSAHKLCEQGCARQNTHGGTKARPKTGQTVARSRRACETEGTGEDTQATLHHAGASTRKHTKEKQTIPGAGSRVARPTSTRRGASRGTRPAKPNVPRRRRRNSPAASLAHQRGLPRNNDTLRGEQRPNQPRANPTKHLAIAPARQTTNKTLRERAPIARLPLDPEPAPTRTDTRMSGRGRGAR